MLAGTPLDLYCRIDRTQYKGPRTAHDIEFVAGQMVLPSEDVYVVNTISFFNDRYSWRFYCRLPETRNYNNTLLGVQLVHVASKYDSLLRFV